MLNTDNKNLTKDPKTLFMQIIYLIILKLINLMFPLLILLNQQLKIHPIICQILVQRGIVDYSQARSYFRPDLGTIHSPWLMKDMEIACLRNNIKL